MKLTLIFFGVLTLATTSECLRILHSDGAATNIPSPILNRHLGKQFFERITAPGVFLGHKNICSLSTTQLASFCQGSIAFFIRTSWDFWDFDLESRNLDCLTNAGAVGMVVAYPLFYEPGLGARVSSPRVTKHQESSIPALHIVTHHVSEDILQRILTSNITVELVATPNQYEDLWASRNFFLFWRLAFPIINGIGALLGFAGIGLLVVNVYNVKGIERSNRWKHSSWLVAGFVIMTAMCVIRFFYCATGPFYSSLLPGFTMDFHLLMLNFTILFETIASMIAIALFRRWGEFGMSKRELLVHKVLGLLAGISLCVCLTVVVLQLTHVTDASSMAKVVKPALLVTLGAIVSLVALQRVSAFLLPRAIAHTETKLHRSSRLIRVSLLMLISEVMNAVVLISLATAMVFRGRVMFSLHGHYVNYTVIFGAVTLQGLAHMFALYPSTSTILRHTKWWNSLRIARAESVLPHRTPVFGKKTTSKHIVVLGTTTRDLLPTHFGPNGAQMCLMTSDSDEPSLSSVPENDLVPACEVVC
eukprot:c52701_g1_i1.p1 GENE.c52701_g1_i1~~c52701_g1_i1.p1  ORF type:complete len:532 (+),score=103.50 c52701_g1_i1:43-1638(+)